MRITDSAALEHVKDAAGSLRAQIEALLSMGLPNSPMQGSRIRVCSGNFVTARPIGVVDGVDFHHTGKVRRIDVAGIHHQLADGLHRAAVAPGLFPHRGDFQPRAGGYRGAVRRRHRRRQAGHVRQRGRGSCDDAGNLIRQCTVGDIERLDNHPIPSRPRCCTPPRAPAWQA